MRIPPPSTLRLDRHALLQDVRERLAARLPDTGLDDDPTHPAWLVLEEAAWMVESLTEQLDRYPWAVVQQLAHLLGTSLHAARPALGVVTLASSGHGEIVFEDGPPSVRVLTLQTEERDLVEFVPAEASVALVDARVEGLSRLEAGSLYRSDVHASRGAEQPDLCVWLNELVPSRAFRREVFEYRLVAADLAKLDLTLREAIARLREERWPGWLRLQVAQEADAVYLTAVIDVSAAMEDATITPAGDVIATWRSLDESTWTPPVHVSQHPVLPPRLRGSLPLHEDDGRVLIAGVPQNMLREEILVRDAIPAPDDVPILLWKTLTHLDRRLDPIKPEIKRSVDVVDTDEPTWVDDALRGRAWHRIVERPDATLAHIRLHETSEVATRVRFAWVHAGTVLSTPRAFALHQTSGLLPTSLAMHRAWTLPLPDPSGTRMLRVTAFDLVLPSHCTGFLATADGDVRGVMLNALLMLNAPFVVDEREETVTRAVPDVVNLLVTDVVTREVLGDLADSGLSSSVREALAGLSVSRIDVEGAEPIIDFRGLSLDPTEGTMTLLGPDAHGSVRRLPRGSQLTLRWYRRTDGEIGNCEAGALSFVEQDTGVTPRLIGASNPLPTAWGSACERPEDAMRRVFGPPASLPITSADWEREIRIALGARADGWTLRVWGYAERTLMSVLVWPPVSVKEDASRDALVSALDVAGSDVLMVALGPLDRTLNAADLAWAREAIEALVRRWTDRVPTVRQAIVTPLHAIRVRGTVAGPFPRFSLHDVDGVLVDNEGSTLEHVSAVLCLNAAIVGLTS